MIKEDKEKLILFILPGLSFGGCEIAMLKLANAFSLKYKIGLVVFGPFKKKITNKRIKILFKGSSLIKSMPLFINYLLKLRINRSFKRFYFISSMNYINVTIVVFLRIIFPFQKVILTERNVLLVADRTKRLFRFEIIKMLMKINYRLADQIISVSNDVLKDVQQITKINSNKLSVIYNPILSNKELDLRKKNERDYKNISEKKIIKLISVGRLVPQKGFPNLIKAISILKKHFNNKILLEIYGEGYIKNKLEILIENNNLIDNVKLMGYTEDIDSKYKEADVFVMTSFFEGLPGVLIEAMSHGLPVAACKCKGGVEEILEGGKWGELINSHDPFTISKGIKNAIMQPINPIDRVNDFTEDKCVSKYLEILDL